MSGTGHPEAEDLWLGQDPDVLAHLSSCPTCAATLAQLRREQDEVTARLRALDLPGPIPPELRGRLHRVIAEEAAHRERRGDPLRAARDRPAPPRFVGGLLPRWLVAASAVAVLVLGGSALLPLLWPDGAGDDGVVTAESAPSQPRQESSGDAEVGIRVPPVPGDLLARGEALARDVIDAPADDTADDTADEAVAGGQSAVGPTTCGAALAQATASVVVASADLAAAEGGGVLVVTQTPSGSDLWWLPDCDAGVEQALGLSALDDPPSGMPAP